jgi:hypothetical protein
MSTGIVVKPSILNRNKTKTPSVSSTEMELTASVDMYDVSGSDGGTFGSLDQYLTRYNEEVSTYIGMLTREDHAHEEPKFNGEFRNSRVRVSDGELNRENLHKKPSQPLILFDLTFFSEIPQDCGLIISIISEFCIIFS